MNTMRTAGSPPAAAEPESLAELIGDSRHMAPHWEVPAAESVAVAPSSLHGITVPAASVHVVDGMADYGD
jgi:hypothetical protein